MFIKISVDIIGATRCVVYIYISEDILRTTRYVVYMPVDIIKATRSVCRYH